MASRRQSPHGPSGQLTLLNNGTKVPLAATHDANDVTRVFALIASVAGR
jgi:hypothetical protein